MCCSMEIVSQNVVVGANALEGPEDDNWLLLNGRPAVRAGSVVVAAGLGIDSAWYLHSLAFGPSADRAVLTGTEHERRFDVWRS